jgi:hypothetical protein
MVRRVFAQAPLLVAAALFFTVLRRGKRAVDYMVIGWAIASAIGVASGGLFPHYFLTSPRDILRLSFFKRFARQRCARRGPMMFRVLLVGLVDDNAVLYVAPRAEKQVAENVLPEGGGAQQGSVITYKNGPQGRSSTSLNLRFTYATAARRSAYDWAYQYDEKTRGKRWTSCAGRPSSILTTLPPLFRRAPRQVLTELLNGDYECVGQLYCDTAEGRHGVAEPNACSRQSLPAGPAAKNSRSPPDSRREGVCR